MHQLAVHTIGALVSPSDVLMLIVPSSDQLVVEVQIRPSDIDQLSVGQATRVRFSAFDWATDALQGALVCIAADPSRDPQSKLTHYSAAVRVPERELARLNGRRLLPGMPAEVFITTAQRTIASYLLKTAGGNATASAARCRPA